MKTVAGSVLLIANILIIIFVAYYGVQTYRSDQVINKYSCSSSNTIGAMGCDAFSTDLSIMTQSQRRLYDYSGNYTTLFSVGVLALLAILSADLFYFGEKKNKINLKFLGIVGIIVFTLSGALYFSGTGANDIADVTSYGGTSIYAWSNFELGIGAVISVILGLLGIILIRFTIFKAHKNDKKFWIVIFSILLLLTILISTYLTMFYIFRGF